MAVGPVALVAGTGGFPQPLWKYSNQIGAIGQESIDRLGILYIGHKFSDNSTWAVQNGGWMGTIGIVAGFGTHWLASKVGLNRLLGRYRMPFRI